MPISNRFVSVGTSICGASASIPPLVTLKSMVSSESLDTLAGAWMYGRAIREVRADPRLLLLELSVSGDVVRHELVAAPAIVGSVSMSNCELSPSLRKSG